MELDGTTVSLPRDWEAIVWASCVMGALFRQTICDVGGAGRLLVVALSLVAASPAATALGASADSFPPPPLKGSGRRRNSTVGWAVRVLKAESMGKEPIGEGLY